MFPSVLSPHGMSRDLPQGGLGTWGAQGPLALGSALKTFVRADSVKGRTAAQFTKLNSESLTRTDEAALRCADIDFYFCAWVMFDAAGANEIIALKGTGAVVASTNYVLWKTSADKPAFTIGDNSTTKQALWGSALSTATWYFVEGYHDAANDLVGVCVNRGTDVTAATAGIIPYSASAGAFQVGKDGGGSFYLGGRMQSLVFLKRLPSAVERNALYNSGTGLVYSQRGSFDTTSMVDWWDLTEESGTRAGSFGSLTLTDNNTVTSNDGKVAYAVTADASVVAIGTDQGASALVIQQTTHTKKPLLKTNIINGQPVLRFDGTDDFLKVATGAISNQPLWGWAVVDDNDAATRYYLDGGAASKVSLFHDGTNLNVNAGSSVGAAHSAGAPHLVTFIVNGASSDIRVDGTSIATGDAGAQNQDSGVAVGSDNAGASPLAGDIAEFAFVAGSPSVADLNNLKQYAAQRYGLTIA